MLTDQVVILSSIVFAGILCQWLAWRVKLPAILFLLFTGLVAGPITGWLDADKIFGDLLFPFISLSVAMILFEGSLTLKFQQIAGLQRVVRRMISFGVLVTWLITAAATHFALDLPWDLSLLFGAVTAVTGPTVIVPMLRTVRPTASIANILRWEGIVIDPIGATLAVLVYEFILVGSNGHAISHTLMAFGKIVGIGFLFGSMAGYLFGSVLRMHWLPEFLHNVGTLATVGAAFAVSNALQHESGLLTVTVMGIWLANMRDVPVDEILNFKESLSVLLISVLFIVLASRLDIKELAGLGWPTLIIFLAIQFLARPISVVISTAGSSLTWPERHLLAWIAPRGIVAAAISALFAIQLSDAGYARAELLVPLTFMVIIGTVVLQSSTARFIARWLGVAEPYPKDLLIIGANNVAIAVAEALHEKGFRTLLVDTDWEKISNARMAGLETYFGDAVSEYTERNMDLIGIGRMLALSKRGSLNGLSCMHYRMELGTKSVFALQTKPVKEAAENSTNSPGRYWQTLFGPDVTFSLLEEKLDDGWGIRSTGLTETFTWQDYREQYEGQAIHMFAVNPKGRLHIFTADEEIIPAPGWTLISLVPA